MKRFLAFLLASSMMAALLSGCLHTNAGQPKETDPPETTAAVTEDETVFDPEALPRNTDAVVNIGDMDVVLRETPVTLAGETWFPMLKIFRTLEYSVKWNEENTVATVTADGLSVTMTVDSDEVQINGETLMLSHPAFMIDKDLMLPGAFFEKVADEAGIPCFTIGDRMYLSAKYEKEVYEWLYRFETECFSEDMVDWIVNLYDPESGGFFFKTSAKETEGFLPDLEATTLSLGVLNSLGILDTSKLTVYFSDEMTEKLKTFAQQHQSEEDGYWYELPWGKYVGDSKRLYESSAAQQLLKMIGEKPLYPTASERVEKSTAKAEDATGIRALATDRASLDKNKFKSQKDFKAWFDGYLDWSSPYTAGSLLLSTLGQIEKAGYLTYAKDLIKEKINPDTGFLDNDHSTDELNYDVMSGTYKVAGFFKSCKEEMPYFKTLVENTMQVIVSDEPKCHACHIANPWSLLNTAFDCQKEPDEEVWADFCEQLPELLRRTVEKTLALKTPDGMYSYYAGYGSSGNKGAISAMPLFEGELSAVPMIVTALRTYVYDVLDITAPKMFGGKITAQDVVKRLEEAEPTKKIQFATQCEYTFDDLTEGPIPQKEGMRGTGDITVVKEEDGNRAIRISSDGNGRPVLLFDAGTKNGKGFTCEFDIKFDAPESSALLIVELGSWEFATKVSFRKNGGIYTMSRTTENGKAIKALRDWDEYHRVKIVYTPDGDTATSEYYLDGVLLDTSTYFDNGYPTKPATQNIPVVMFRTDHDGAYTAYIDNFTFAENE